MSVQLLKSESGSGIGEPAPCCESPAAALASLSALAVQKLLASNKPCPKLLPLPRLVLGGKQQDMLPPFRLDHPSSRSLLKDVSIPSTEWPSLPVLTNPAEVPGGFADTKCDFKWEDDLYQSQSSCSVWSVDTQESASLSTSEVRT